MHPHAETSLQNPPTTDDQPSLQPGLGQPGRDWHDDHNDIVDPVDDPTTEPAQPEDEQNADGQPRDAVVDDVPHGEHRVDEVREIGRGDGTGITHDGHEPEADDESVHEDPTAQAPVDDEPAADPHAAEATSRVEPSDPQPSDDAVPPAAAIWDEGSIQNLRDRWREAQLNFVDDPSQAAQDTRNLVNDAVDALTATLASHREQLSSLPTGGDTEQYRLVVQRYRTFFERLLTL